MLISLPSIKQLGESIHYSMDIYHQMIFNYLVALEGEEHSGGGGSAACFPSPSTVLIWISFCVEGWGGAGLGRLQKTSQMVALHHLAPACPCPHPRGGFSVLTLASPPPAHIPSPGAPAQSHIHLMWLLWESLPWCPTSLGPLITLLPFALF